MDIADRSSLATATALRVMALLAIAGIAIAGCASDRPIAPPVSPGTPLSTASTPTRLALAADPAQLAQDLVRDERQLRKSVATSDDVAAAARREQLAYRTIGRHPEFDEVVRPRIPAEFLGTYDRNVAARRSLNQLAPVVDTLPAWQIVAPVPPDELIGYYREAQAQSGVDWNYLAAINLVETGFGRISATSTAGAQGPMQFLPTTFAAYGEGGDIQSPRDSILAAGRYLAASGFATNRNSAIYQYNHSDAYVDAISQYATAIATDPAAFGIYHQWNVYYFTTAGDVLLPEGYAEPVRIPAASYVATHPQ